MTRLRVTIVTVWFVSAAYCSPRIIMYGTVEATVDDKNEALCVLQRALYDSMTYDLVNFVVCFLVPLIIISVLYTIICYQLWHSQAIVSHPQNHISQTSNNHHVGGSSTPALCRSCSDSGSPPSIKKLEYAQTLVTTTRSPKDLTSTVTTAVPYLAPGQGYIEGTQLSRQSSCSRCSHVNTPPRKQATKPFHYVNNAAVSALKPRRKVIRLLVAVVLCFAICNLPFHARKLWQHSKEYNGSSTAAAILTVVTNLVLYLNSGINPFLYALFSKNFRQCMADVLFCRNHKLRFRGRSSFNAMSRSLNSGVTQTAPQTHLVDAGRQAAAALQQL
ncbi:unnamed protein product [Ixodes hexagonus]